MFFRAVLQRWREQPSGGDAVCITDACGSANALLTELAADPEDFADLAAVLNVDLRAVVAALASAEGPRIPDELVAALTAPVAAAAAASRGAPASEPRREATSLGPDGSKKPKRTHPTRSSTSSSCAGPSSFVRAMPWTRSAPVT